MQDFLLINFSIGHMLQKYFHSILLWLDSIIYGFITTCYDIFIKLAKLNIFDQAFYDDFASRIYAILGVVMLFVLAYALLRALVDPEQLTKGDKSVAKLAPNFVVSLVILGLLPSIFSFLYDIQSFVLEKNVVGTLVLGVDTNDEHVQRFGTLLSYNTLHAFLNPNDYDGPFDGVSWNEIKSNISEYNDFKGIVLMAEAIADDKVDYKWGFSTGVGLFLVYAIASFCIDLGIRAVRLAFLQLIAPIPVLMRVVPGQQKIFSNWLKKTIVCFSEVLVRVFIMNIVVLFISNLDRLNINSGGGFQGLIVWVLVVMGIIAFAKDLPKELEEATGIKSGNIKLGLKDFVGKLGAGGALAATALVGAGSTSFLRNMTHGWSKSAQNFKDAKNARGFWNKAAAIGSGVWNAVPGAFLSGVSGSLAAGVSAGAKGMGAKNLADMKNATKEGIARQIEKRDKREAYRAAHSRPTGALSGLDLPFIGGIAGVAQAHVTDAFKDAARFAGLGETSAKDSRVKEAGVAIRDAISTMQKVWKDDEGWKTADENASLAKGAIYKYGDYTKFDKLVSDKKKEYMDAHNGSDAGWDTYYNSMKSNLASQSGVEAANLTNFFNAIDNFEAKDIEVKGIEKAIQGKKANMLAGQARTIATYMEKYADVLPEVLQKDFANLQGIDLANMTADSIDGSVFKALGDAKISAADTVSDVERRDILRAQQREKK